MHSFICTFTSFRDSSFMHGPVAKFAIPLLCRGERDGTQGRCCSSCWHPEENWSGSRRFRHTVCALAVSLRSRDRTFYIQCSVWPLAGWWRGLKDPRYLWLLCCCFTGVLHEWINCASSQKDYTANKGRTEDKKHVMHFYDNVALNPVFVGIWRWLHQLFLSPNWALQCKKYTSIYNNSWDH